jgi:hypothetical protein
MKLACHGETNFTRAALVGRAGDPVATMSGIL